MEDDPDRLKKTLDELKAQLDEMRMLDPKVAAHLDVALDEARAALGGSPVQAAAHRSLMARLGAAVQKYEASHPSLAANLGSLIDALAQIGI